MEWVLKDIAILMACIFTGCFALSFGYGLAIGLRYRISEMSLSRSGMQIHTNDVQVWSSIGDRIRDIDLNTCKSIRKGTERLMILNPEKHGVSAEVMLVNRDAVQPLISAAYENHHADTKSLIYCDPLYVFGTRVSPETYKHEFTDEQHKQLIETLLTVPGHKILSGYESSIYEPLLDADWTLHKKQFPCFASPNKKNRRIECLYCSPVETITQAVKHGKRFF